MFKCYWNAFFYTCFFLYCQMLKRVYMMQRHSFLLQGSLLTWGLIFRTFVGVPFQFCGCFLKKNSVWLEGNLFHNYDVTWKDFAAGTLFWKFFTIREGWYRPFSSVLCIFEGWRADGFIIFEKSWIQGGGSKKSWSKYPLKVWK